MNDFPVFGYTGNGDAYEKRSADAQFYLKNNTDGANCNTKSFGHLYAARASESTAIAAPGV